MKKRLTAILLTLCLTFSLAACSSGGSGEEPQTQESTTAGSSDTAQEASEAEKSEPSGDMSANMTDEEEQEMLAKMTDEEREQYEEYKEFKKQKDETNASTEVNEYGITDESLQSLADAIKENVTSDYLNVYNISSSDFSWPEAGTTFWDVTGSVITLAVNVGQFFNLPDMLFKDLSDEDTALAKAVLSGIAEWEDTEDESFYQSIFGALSDENGLSAEKTAQFFADHITFE